MVQKSEDRNPFTLLKTRDPVLRPPPAVVSLPFTCGPLGSDTCLFPVLQEIKAVQMQVLARGSQYLKPGHLKGKQEVGWAAVSRSKRDTR